VNSNAFSAADMTTAAANGHRDGYQAGYADAVKAFEASNPAAAQEAVAYRLEVQTEGVEPFTQYVTDHAFIATLRNAGCQVNATALYETAPVTAAPVADTRLANWIIAAVGDIPYSTMTSGQVIDALRTNRHVYEGNEGCGTYYKGDNTPAAPGIDLEQFREAVAHWKRDLHDDYKGGHIHDGGEAMRKAEHLLALIGASPKGGSTDVEPKIWGTQKPGSMPKLFGAHHIAELNWYPDEGYDLICMQVVERLQATSAEVGS